jgi:hypothetical protein
MERARAGAKTAVPVIVVPFMGPGGRECCEREGIGWIDLCGNACVSGPGLRLFVADQPNRFARRGRPRTVFAPRSSRVVRGLFATFGKFVSQRELSRESGLNEGSTSRIVKKLEEDGFLGRAADGKVCVLDANVLLQAWDCAGSFFKNRILYGHTPSAGGAKLLCDVVDLLKAHSVEYAATGPAGAWAWEALDDFHLVTLYLREPPSPELLDTLQADHKLSFQARDTDANLWLVSPQDDGVFQGAVEKKGVHTVAPLQVYLDLAAHQESTDSAREILRSQI